MKFKKIVLVIMAIFVLNTEVFAANSMVQNLMNKEKVLFIRDLIIDSDSVTCIYIGSTNEVETFTLD